MSTTASSSFVGPVTPSVSSGGVSSSPASTPTSTPPRLPSFSTIDCGLPGIRFFQSYLWKFIITNLNTETITSLDQLASNRAITYTFEDATEITFDVPSDNPRVNIPYVDGFPKLDEGTRLVICLRQEGFNSWKARATGIIMNVSDSGDPEVSRTSVTAYDPWRYLDFIPLINPDAPKFSAGIVYVPAGKKTSIDQIEVSTVAEVILDQLRKVNDYYNTGADSGLFIDWLAHTAFYDGTTEVFELPFAVGWQNGATVGDMLRSLSQDKDQKGYDLCDLVFEPVYDPVNRPGIISQLNIYKSHSTSGSRLKPEVVFSWGKPPRTASSATRLQDGTQRSNEIVFHHSRGGPSVHLKKDVTSQARFKTYNYSRHFPTQGGFVESLESLATEQLVLRANGIETITVNPTPEVAKVPLVDYMPGDTVSVSISNNMRKQSFDQYRVYQIPIQISDEALESVQQLTLKKDVPPDAVAPSHGPVTEFANAVTGNEAVISRGLRRGTITRPQGVG